MCLKNIITKLLSVIQSPKWKQNFPLFWKQNVKWIKRLSFFIPVLLFLQCWGMDPRASWALDHLSASPVPSAMFYLFVYLFIPYLFICFLVLEFELRASCWLERDCATWATDHQFWRFFFFCGTGVWTPGVYLEPLYQPFFVMGFSR
jgi:hypothetical protein